MYRKKSNKGLVSTICILLVIVLVVGFLGFVTQGFKNWDTKTWFEKENIEEPPAVDSEGNELETGKVYSLPSSLSFRKASTTNQSGITLQATILPTNATEKAVDWSVAWVENTGFAVDKNVTDYVTVTPNSDGSNVAVVNCLQPFGTQIKIVVASRENEEKKAECLVDYLADSYKTVTTITGTNNYTFDSSKSELVYLTLGFYGRDSICNSVSFENTAQGTYTKTESIDEKQAKFELTNEFIAFMNTKYSYVLDSTKTTAVAVTNGLNMNADFCKTLLGTENVSKISGDFETKFSKAVEDYQNEGKCAFMIKQYYLLNGQVVSNDILFKIHLQSFYVSVSDIVLDNNTIVL